MGAPFHYVWAVKLINFRTGTTYASTRDIIEPSPGMISYMSMVGLHGVFHCNETQSYLMQ